jgi:hypothetical protein
MIRISIGQGFLKRIVSRSSHRSIGEIILPSNDSAILFLIRVDSLNSRLAAAFDFNWLNCYEN